METNPVTIKVVKHTKHKGKLVEPGTILSDLEPNLAGEFLATGVATLYGENERKIDELEASQKGGKKSA